MWFKFCPYTLLLIIIFSVGFSYTIFINYESLFTMMLLEADPGNLAWGVMKLFDEPVYSQYNYWFSSSYGWFFNDINFLVVLILKVVGKLLGFYEPPIFGLANEAPIFNIAIKSVNFIFALISLLLFFKVADRLFANQKIALIASIFFMFIPWSAFYTYTLHPDSAGMALTLLAILLLLKFIQQEPKISYFFIASTSLLLAVLCKPYFGFFAIPVFLLFFITYCHKNQLKYSEFFFSQRLLKTLILFLFISIITIITVHPYSLFYIVERPMWLFMPWIYLKSAQVTAIPIHESFYNWALLYLQEPLVFINLLLLILLTIISICPIYLVFKEKFAAISYLWVSSILFCGMYLLLVLFGNRMAVSLKYLYPIAPLLILNVVAVILFIWKHLDVLFPNKIFYAKAVFAILLGGYGLSSFLGNTLETVNMLLYKALYKQSTLYQANNFIINELMNNKKFTSNKVWFDISRMPFPPVAPLSQLPKATWVSHLGIQNRNYLVKQEVLYVELNDNLLKNIQPEFIILAEWRRDMTEDYYYTSKVNYRKYLREYNYKLIKEIPGTQYQFDPIFTYFLKDINTFEDTKQLVTVLRNPNELIGSTILFYQR